MNIWQKLFFCQIFIFIPFFFSLIPFLLLSTRSYIGLLGNLSPIPKEETNAAWYRKVIWKAMCVKTTLVSTLN